MSGHLPLGGGREFDRIRAIIADAGDGARELGDDAAVLPGTSVPMVASVDASVEGVHFRFDWLTPREVGWRAAAGAISDLAAMGAGCSGVLAAITMPKSGEADRLREIMRGVTDATLAAGGQLLGGDLSAGPGWIISITVLGPAARPVSRRGAVDGDGLWVTGALGGARAALHSWEAGRTPPAAARAAFAQPEPRLAAGRWLAAHGAHAMMDVSDGLAGDLPHLAAASGLGADVDLAMVPVHPDVADLAGREGITPAQFAAEGGEDYELLVALPDSFAAADATQCLIETGVPLTRLGTFCSLRGVRWALDGQPIRPAGWDHFW